MPWTAEEFCALLRRLIASDQRKACAEQRTSRLSQAMAQVWLHRREEQR